MWQIINFKDLFCSNLYMKDVELIKSSNAQTIIQNQKNVKQSLRSNFNILSRNRRQQLEIIRSTENAGEQITKINTAIERN